MYGSWLYCSKNIHCRVCARATRESGANAVPSAKYQTMALEDKSNKRAQESLHYGVSYARSTRDPLARAIAEECLSGLDIAL